MITHSAPAFCHPVGWNPIVYDFADEDPGLHKDLQTERNLLNKKMFEIITEKNVIQKWYYGHFHQSHKTKHLGTEFILLGINEFQEIRLSENAEGDII